MLPQYPIYLHEDSAGNVSCGATDDGQLMLFAFPNVDAIKDFLVHIDEPADAEFQWIEIKDGEQFAEFFKQFDEEIPYIMYYLIGDTEVDVFERDVFLDELQQGSNEPD